MSKTVDIVSYVHASGLARRQQSLNAKTCHFYRC